MRTVSIRNAIRLSAAALPLLAGCASMRPPEPQRIDYGAEAFARIRDSILGAPELGEAQDRAPRVDIVTSSFLGADRYVDASIRVSEDAYVVVVAADFDGRYRVVFPETPEESGFVRAGASHKLSKFFAGFGSAGLAQYGRSAFSIQPVGRQGTRGAIVAIASDRPLQLARITDGGGEWSEAQLERVLRYLGTGSAAYALGRELSLVGQEFDVDYSGFTQNAGTPTYALARYGSGLCESEQTGSLYYDGPPPIRFFIVDGTRYARVAVGDPCSGFTTRIVPVGPASEPVPRDTAAVPQGSGGEARIAGRNPNSSGSSGRPDVGLRFRPPEHLRSETRQREQSYEQRVRSSEDVDKHRRMRESGERTAPRAEPVRREAPRPEPTQIEPVRAEPSAPQPAPTERAPAGKPMKDN